MLMDTSSELIHSLLPVFMASVLGASMVTIGLIEGVAEATAAITKVFSGALSDILGKRKLLAVLGYGLAAATKPVFPLATTIGWVFGARFVDRIGKGIRGAPRDALVAEIAPQDLRGAAFGLRQSLDSVGGFLGPLLALAALAVLADDIRKVLWIAVVPGFLAVALLVAVVREPERPADGPGGRPPLTRADLRRLPGRYWLVVLLGAVFTLARFSEALLAAGAISLARVPPVLIAPRRPLDALVLVAGPRALLERIPASRLARGHPRRSLAVGPAHGPDPGPVREARRRARSSCPAPPSIFNLVGRLAARGERLAGALWSVFGGPRSRSPPGPGSRRWRRSGPSRLGGSGRAMTAATRVRRGPATRPGADPRHGRAGRRTSGGPRGLPPSRPGRRRACPRARRGCVRRRPWRARSGRRHRQRRRR